MQVGHQRTHSGGSCFALVGCMAEQSDHEKAQEISQRMAQRRCAKYRALSHCDAVVFCALRLVACEAV